MANAWKITSQQIGLQAIDATDTTQNHTLGLRIRAKHVTYGEGEFIYLKGATSTAVASWVTYYPDDWSTTLLAANAIGAVAISMSANSSSSNYGWYQIFGKGVGKALSGYVDNALVYATATAGSVDDAVVSGDRVKGALGASALDTPSTGLAEFELNYPLMDDGSAA